jgi:triacylglycerol lipase
MTGTGSPPPQACPVLPDASARHRRDALVLAARPFPLPERPDRACAVAVASVARGHLVTCVPPRAVRQVRSGTAGASHAMFCQIRRALTPTGLRAAGKVAWSAAHLVLSPLQVSCQRLLVRPAGRAVPQRSPLSPDGTAQRPILLVHGFGDTPGAMFTLLRRALRRWGLGPVQTMSYSPLTPDVPTAAQHLARRVEQIRAETGQEHLHIIGHSLGGLIARYYVQRLGGQAHVDILITVGTPHGGTAVARLLPHFPFPLLSQLRPGSALLAELAAPAPGCRTRFVAFYSDLDELIIPAARARIDHPDLAARNVVIPGAGHLALPLDDRVVSDVCLILARPERQAGHGAA